MRTVRRLCDVDDYDLSFKEEIRLGSVGAELYVGWRRDIQGAIYTRFAMQYPSYGRGSTSLSRHEDQGCISQELAARGLTIFQNENESGPGFSTQTFAKIRKGLTAFY